ncbi:Tocopherol O-methyltransferase [Balamuthia mandrillaris]
MKGGGSNTTTAAVLKERIKEHYNELSPYYHDLWGRHIHHGYWVTGKETKEEAQVQMMEELARRAGLSADKELKILDVGCGVGGGSIFLAKRFNAHVTGITLSPVQAEMAKQIATKENATDLTTFHQLDAEQLQDHILASSSSSDPSQRSSITPASSGLNFEAGSFDVIWISEVLSHLSDRDQFFRNSNRLLRRGGRLALVGWLKAEGLTPEKEQQYVQPIVEGMLLPSLSTMADYEKMLQHNGFRVVSFEDISDRVSKTWDICLDIITNPTLWKLAFTKGGDFIAFLKAFKAMRAGFASKTFVYGMLVAEKEEEWFCRPLPARF